MGEGLSEEDLAQRAGTTADAVRKLVEHEIIVPSDDEGGFHPADVQRIRLARALESSGIPAEAIGKAISAGHVTFAFLGLIWPEPVRVVPGITLGQHAAQQGLSFETVQRTREVLGLPRGEPDDPIREDDVDVMATLVSALAAGFSEDTVTAHNHLLGESLRRIAASQVQLFHANIEEPMLSAGLTQQQILHFASQLGVVLEPMVEKVIVTLYRRHLEHYIVEDLITHVEDAIQKVGLGRRRATDPGAVAFLEVAGFSGLHDESVPDAPETPRSLGDFAGAVVADAGGRPVKLVADSVMIHFPDPSHAPRAALRLVERALANGLPAARVGLDAGPLVVSEGDLFGKPVEAARCIAQIAKPGQVVSSREALVAAGEDEGDYEPLGNIELPGVADPVALFAAPFSDEPR